MLEKLNNELEQRVAERTEELRQSEEQFRTRAELLELASEAIMVRGMTGQVQFWNAGAENLYGWQREEVLGKDIHTVLQTVFPVPREEIETTLRDARSGKAICCKRTKDGSEVIVACRKTMNHEGNAVLEVSRDITAQLQAEEALRETEKLAAMGRVAGIIAHEINNPLAAITNIFLSASQSSFARRRGTALRRHGGAGIAARLAHHPPDAQLLSGVEAAHRGDADRTAG